VNIDGAVALVAGGASGLGLATATALADAGARVVVLDLPGGGAPAGMRFAGGDVAVEDDVAAAVATATEVGPLRIVVNCAGIAPAARISGRNGPHPLADFERVLRVNLIGTFNVLRLAAAAMQATDPVDGERGVIVNTSSVAAFDGQIGQAAYAASKGGVAALTLPAAREFARSLIRVVTIAPGIFETPMTAAFTDEVRASLEGQIPHPARLGRPAEYASLVRAIVENPYLNGETIRLDGAVRMGAS
jgi:NAD(P)-dependent dehydrogenase (short-subunit alcohol dehydrogenase family)